MSTLGWTIWALVMAGLVVAETILLINLIDPGGFKRH